MSRRPGRRFADVRADLASIDPGRRHRARGGRSVRPRRRARQQRRHHPPRGRARVHRRRLGRRHGRQPEDRVLSFAGGRRGSSCSRHSGGKIINIASMLSFQGGIRVPSYTASKSGVIGLTRLLANEWAAHGINVNAIAPGYMATEQHRGAARRRAAQRRDSRTHSGGPLGHARRSRRAGRVPRVVRVRLRARPYARGRRRLARALSVRRRRHADRATRYALGAGRGDRHRGQRAGL